MSRKLPVYPLEHVPEIRKLMAKESCEYSREFVEINNALVERMRRSNRTEANLVRAFRNKFFLVQIYQHPNDTLRMSVNRAELNDDGFWRDGITWDELQHIKNKLGYAEYDAIEIYPKEIDIVDVANIRHLWIRKDWGDLEFIWRKK